MNQNQNNKNNNHSSNNFQSVCNSINISNNNSNSDAGFQSHRELHNRPFNQGLSMTGINQPAPGPYSGGVQIQSPGSSGGSSHSYFRSLPSPSMTGSDGAIEGYFGPGSPGVLGAHGSSGANQSRHQQQSGHRFGTESPLESLAALSVMSPTLPMPLSISRNNSGYSSGVYPPASSTMLETPSMQLSSRSASAIPPSTQSHSQAYSTLFQGQNSNKMQSELTIHSGSTYNNNNGNGDKNSDGKETVGRSSSQSSLFSQASISSSVFSPSSNAQSNQQLQAQQVIMLRPTQQYSQLQPTVASSMQASLTTHPSFNQYSFNQSQFAQQQPTPGQSPQSNSQIKGFTNKNIDAAFINKNGNQSNVNVARSASHSDSTSSSTESSRGRSRSGSLGGTGLIIPPLRNLPPRVPQISAPRKYHGRQSRKPPLPAHTMPHHHIQQYQGYIPPHHHSSPPYQYFPAREPAPPTRRLAHIMSEQKRREKINGGFDELKSVIPECSQNTDSKATILRKAVDYILQLEDELRKYTGHE